MRRNLVQSVAVLLLAMHGLISVAGNAGLHTISGCVHGYDTELYSDRDESPCLDRHACSHEAQRSLGSSIQAGSCLAESHDCPICHWWYSGGRLIVVAGSVVCVDLQPLTGM